MSPETGTGGEPVPYDPNPWPLYVRRGPRRWPWVLGAGLVLAVVLGSALALQSGDGSDGAVSAVDPTSTPTGTPTDPVPSSSPEPEPSEQPTEEPSREPTTEPTDEPARVRCWDGTRVGRLADCSPPAGRAGLEHVFPSLPGQSCRERVGRAPAGRVLALRCTDELEDGTRVVIEYAQWGAVADGVAHFDGLGLERADVPEILGWNGRDGGRYAASFLYARHPYSAIWFAPDPDRLGLALSTALVAGRPPREVRGHPIP